MRALFVLAILITPLYARDLNGQFANSELHNWFLSLHNQQLIPCCDTADGRRISDADWDTDSDHYKVRVDGTWYRVPDEAVITGPNKAGTAIVWPYVGPDGMTHIRCFIPGSGM